MASRSNHSPPVQNRAEQQFERTLQSLRILWATNGAARTQVRQAVEAYRQLIPVAAATNEMQATLQRSIDQLERLPMEASARRPVVESLAAELKALKPRLGLLEPAAEIGVLNIAAGESAPGASESQRSGVRPHSIACRSMLP